MKKYCTAWHSLLSAFQSTLLRWESAVEGPEVVEMVKLVAHDARPGPRTPGGGISEQMSRDWEAPGQRTAPTAKNSSELPSTDGTAGKRRPASRMGLSKMKTQTQTSLRPGLGV